MGEVAAIRAARHRIRIRIDRDKESTTIPSCNHYAVSALVEEYCCRMMHAPEVLRSLRPRGGLRHL